MKQPSTMKASRSRKQGLIHLVDTVCSNLDKVGGCRVEVRVRGREGLTLKKALTEGEETISNLLGALGTKLFLRKVAVESYRAFVKKELSASVTNNVFRGMLDTGLEEHQRDLFNEKVQGWSTLVANIGFVSGHFSRLLRGSTVKASAPAPAPTPLHL